MATRPGFQDPSYFRPRDLEAKGVSFGNLQRMAAEGAVEKVGRGLYHFSDAEVTELDTIAAVCARVPEAIVCLLSALAVHDIGTQLPSEVWIALDRKKRKPQFEDLPVHLVRYSGPMLTYGIEARDIQGVRVQITNPARTVIDCFRYRNKIGLDVGLEALQDVLKRRIATANELVWAAEACRIATVLRPYLMVAMS
jgi:predicted transcriptional regulator of viral defense system